jgi:hypothetical protein
MPPFHTRTRWVQIRSLQPDNPVPLAVSLPTWTISPHSSQGRSSRQISRGALYQAEPTNPLIQVGWPRGSTRCVRLPSEPGFDQPDTVRGVPQLLAILRSSARFPSVLPGQVIQAFQKMCENDAKIWRFEQAHPGSGAAEEKIQPDPRLPLFQGVSANFSAAWVMVMGVIF